MKDVQKMCANELSNCHFRRTELTLPESQQMQQELHTYSASSTLENPET